MKWIRFLQNLTDETHPYFEHKRQEAIEVYDMSKDAGERPYVYYFPYSKCPHAMNAIDKKVRDIWKTEENRINASKDNSESAISDIFQNSPKYHNPIAKAQ